MSSPLKIEDFDLSPDEMKDLVSGAQKYLAPAQDPKDEERAVDRSAPESTLE